jgi:polysaccharide deacetylase family protein (PEP-CTERM system associated)
MDTEKYILLTIDVEDWFQVENFRSWIPFETWDKRELRVEHNVHNLLNLFDSVDLAGRQEARGQEADRIERNEAGIRGNLKGSEHPSFPASQPASLTQKDELKSDGQRTTNDGHTKKVCATFFVLGWIAERLPHLVREIHSRDHEVASHGYNHNLCNQQSHDDLKKELNDSKKLLEDIIGSSVSGFRAPNFSITDDTLKIAEDCGYLYDSSYNSFGLHGRYGKISLNGHRKQGIAHQISKNFFEIPISNFQLLGQTLPWGGGAYFRLIPLPLFSLGINKILKKENAYLFYIHPWEIDPQQPIVKESSLNYRFRHYTNLSRTKTKLTSLLESFQSCQFITCSSYIKLSRKL